MDKALKSLEELAKHNKLLNPAPIAGYRNKHNRRWEAVCQQVCSVYVTKVCVHLSLSLSLSPHLSFPPPSARWKAGKSSVVVARTI